MRASCIADGSKVSSATRMRAKRKMYQVITVRRPQSGVGRSDLELVRVRLGCWALGGVKVWQEGKSEGPASCVETFLGWG